MWAESTWRFTQADDFYRSSDFVANVEAVRGGPAGIFASNDPLAIVNLISREGTDQMHGEYKLETSDYGEFRNEGYVSGPINQSTTFAIGGFYRTDNGIRRVGFTADKGGQLMANLKYNLPNDKGHLKVSVKIFDDRPVFLGDMPYYNARFTGTAHPSTIPGGPDLTTGAWGVSPDTRFFDFPNTPAGPLNYDLANGYMGSYYYLGADIDYSFSESLKLTLRNRYSQGYHETNGLAGSAGETFNSAGIATAASLGPLQNIADALATNSRTGSPNAFAAALQPSGHYDFMLTYPGYANGTTGSVAAANPAAAATLNGNGLGGISGWGYVKATMTNYQQDIRLTQSWNGGNTTLTGGLYYSYFTVATFGESSQELLSVSPRPMRMDITFLNAGTGAPIGQYSYHGITQLSSTYLNNYADNTEVDYYADFTQKIGSLSLDAGFRYLTASLYGSAEQAINEGAGATGGNTLGFNGNQSIGAVAATNNGLGFYPALTESIFGNGNFDSASSNSHGYSDTIGLNYVLPDHHTALFARYARGVKLNFTNDILQSIPNGANATSGITPYNPNDGVVSTEEGGLKYSSGSVGLFLTAFDEQARNVTANATIAGVFQSSVLNENVTGIEAEAVWAPEMAPGLSFILHGTLQSPKFISGSAAQTEPNPVTGVTIPITNLDGLQPERIPKDYGELTVSYILPRISWGTPALNATCVYTGKNPLDILDDLYAAAFYQFDAGASFTTKAGIVFRVNVANLTNCAGLTEGNPISSLNPSSYSTNTFFVFRPVEPRSIVGSVTYQF